VFGRDHGYCSRFSRLTFEEPTARDYNGELWEPDKVGQSQRDLSQAENIIEQALEEAALPIPTPVTREPAAKAIAQSEAQAPPVINVYQTQSQTQTQSITKYLDKLASLRLPEETRKEAEKNLAELSEEFKGEQRWEKMGPALGALKKIGKGVYEQVALPLLAELAKKAIGLA
jgi:hypothetical protein